MLDKNRYSPMLHFHLVERQQTTAQEFIVAAVGVQTKKEKTSQESSSTRSHQLVLKLFPRGQLYKWNRVHAVLICTECPHITRQNNTYPLPVEHKWNRNSSAGASNCRYIVRTYEKLSHGNLIISRTRDVHDRCIVHRIPEPSNILCSNTPSIDIFPEI